MEDQHIRICKKEIEKRLDWGPCDQWTNQDFELLVEEIFIKTNTNLSLTTLKRIWGKVDYQSNPSGATLNVLAQYLGFAHWRDFQKNHSTTDKAERNISIKRPIRPLNRFFNRKTVVALVVIISLSSVFFFIDQRQVFYKAEEVVFKSKMVSSGLPNTVIFEYDISKVIADSFHIQQSWDRRRRVKISPQDTKHTAFYYYPGYFHAKLIANSEIIKEHEVLVESNGWIGMIERFPEPIYINDLLTTGAGYLGVEINNYPKKADHIQDKNFWVDYYYVKDFGTTDANNFDFECRIRNNSDLGSICHESRISVICTSGRFNIPVCMPGCVSNINVTLNDVYLSGKHHDLSALGCDITEWTNFNLKVENRKCEITIGDQLRLSHTFKNDPGKIVGFKFKFNGAGEVDMLKLSELDNSIIFEDSFDSNL